MGEWLLQTKEFSGWYDGHGGDESDNKVLFCYGDPGVGKTFIRYQGRTSEKKKKASANGYDVSSLVIDKLCDQAGGRNFTVACFYFDFAARKEQSPPNILGALLKQLVHGLGTTPGEISWAYQYQKSAIGGRGPQLSDIVRMVQTTASRKPTFICVDALDECVAEYRVKILDSLNQILQRSSGVRVFVTGRPHIKAEVANRLSGKVTTIHVTPRRPDIINYIHSRLCEDTTPDAMNGSLKADILEKIPEEVSDM